jgi:homoserine O-acetyltransferase
MVKISIMRKPDDGTVTIGKGSTQRSCKHCCKPLPRSLKPPSQRRQVAQNPCLLETRLGSFFGSDANDHLYQWDSSRDYNPAAGLERISAALLAINSADDERNPPETGTLEREIKRVKNGRIYLVPASELTAGHGTTFQAKFWKSQLADLLQTAPRLGK